jgi:Resolvase, N terminal domain
LLLAGPVAMSISCRGDLDADDCEAGFADDLDRAFNFARFPTPSSMLKAAGRSVSTEHQGANGNGMAAQRKAVEDYLNGGRWKLVAEFTEVESGKRNDRPELEKALNACRKHKAKLVIAKLDRLSRNVHFISGLIPCSFRPLALFPTGVSPAFT